MVPIDGAYTMGMPLMVDVIKQVQPKIVLPMHYWGRAQVDRFESLMSELDADFVWPDRRTIEVVREELPEKLTVMVVGGNGGD
jgi:L-ascorbate metabolism protein UlaG (beta-lactamase superfamily)